MAANILTFDLGRRRHSRLSEGPFAGEILPFIAVRYQRHDDGDSNGGSERSVNPLDDGGNTRRKQ